MADKPTSKERRQHERIADPAICLAVDGKTYTCVNWSLGGFLIDKYKGDLTPGSIFTISELGPSKAKLSKVSVQARVIRLDEKPSALAVTILEIDTQAYAILQLLLAEKMQAMKKVAEAAKD